MAHAFDQHEGEKGIGEAADDAEDVRQGGQIGRQRAFGDIRKQENPNMIEGHEQKRDDLEPEAETRVSRHKAVGHPPAEKNRRECDEVVIEHRMRPGRRAVEPEPLVEHLGRPRDVGVVDAAYRDEASRRKERGRAAEERLEPIEQRPGAFGPPPGRTGIPVLEEPDERNAQQEPRCAEHDEHAVPRADEAERLQGENAAQHQARVQRGLVNGKRKRTRLAVVRCEQRHRAGPVEALAAPRSDGTEQDDSGEGRRKAKPHGRNRPEDERAGYDPLAAESVAEKTGDERHHGNRQEQDGVDVPKLAVSERQVCLHIRKQHAEDGAVGLMEEVSPAQERDHGPPIPAAHVVRRDCASRGVRRFRRH